MPKKRRTFDRPLGGRRYKKIFFLSVEGSKTEPQYFDCFIQLQLHVLVKILKRPSAESSPKQVLKRMEDHLRKEGLKKTDEAWVVVDKDSWAEDQLRELLNWAKKSKNRGVAISNPNFEYWILLHFEEGKSIANPQECLARLKRHLPNYKKGIDGRKITLELIAKAITRAKQRDANQVNDWPKLWSTSVYKLVERIINHR
jgi:hypothetical protein